MNKLLSRMNGRLLAAAVTSALAAVLAVMPASAGGVHFGYSTGKHDPDKFQYAIIESGSQTTCSVSGDDSWARIEKLQKEVKATGRQLMWFNVDGKDYVVRDAGALRRAQEIVRPMSELGRQQGELGAQQGELGARQGELGALQGRMGALQARIAALQMSRDSETRSEAAELRRQLDALSADTRELGARQRELGDRQRVLGERQRILGERQRAASQLASEQLQNLAASSIRNGTAERL